MAANVRARAAARIGREARASRKRSYPAHMKQACIANCSRLFRRSHSAPSAGCRHSGSRSAVFRRRTTRLRPTSGPSRPLSSVQQVVVCPARGTRLPRRTPVDSNARPQVARTKSYWVKGRACRPIITETDPGLGRFVVASGSFPNRLRSRKS